MSRYWSEGIAALEPYVPGEQPRVDNLVKLNTNENPYPPSPAALDAIRSATDDSLRRYPDPTSSALIGSIAARHGVSVDQVFVGNGSDEVLAHAFLGLLKRARPILFPDITYSFYPVYCDLYGIEARPVALDDAFGIRAQDYDGDIGGVIFPNPNAPTGLALGNNEVRGILERNAQVPVIVDEAYADFATANVIGLVAAHPNLLVVRTLSKSHALAGLRVGYAVGQRHLIEALERVKGSFNAYPLDRLALAGASAALDDVDYFEQTRDRIVANRRWLSEALVRLDFEVLPSSTNFVFARHRHRDGAMLHAMLRERKILVRRFDQPRIEQYLRISIGTEEECRTLVDALEQILAGENATQREG